MINIDETTEYEGLKFFGKMNASISHELRNSLAVINENAGLIKDLILFSEKGHTLDIGKISGRVDKVLEQVRKTDSIVDNMNRLAHSVDNAFMKVNTSEYLEFVIKLMERFATMKGVSLRPELPEETIEVTTFPFLLENLLYLCLDWAIENPSEEKTIIISIQKKEDRIQFNFKGMFPGIKKDSITGSKDILEKLGATIINDSNSGTFILDMPVEPGI